MLSVQQFLTKNDVTAIPHRPYSLDLTLSGFLFVSLDEKVKQKRAEILKCIKIDKFKNCFEQWKKHLDRCIASDAEHFEDE